VLGYCQLNIEDLSPNCRTSGDDQFVILRSYFDGGNQADSTQYDILTVAVISGTKDQWAPIESAWAEVLRVHHVGFLHTTDAVALNDPYSKRNGWDEARRDKFINDCVSAVEPLLARQLRPNEPEGHGGAYPCMVSIDLHDHQTAQIGQAHVPKDANEICAVQALRRCLEFGTDIVGAHFYHLIFDQGEPFRGYIEDRRRNGKVRKEHPLLDRITSVTDADMRSVPALQVADLFAWSVSHRNRKSYFSWQKRVLMDLDWMDDLMDSKILSNPNQQFTESVNRWRLPRRRPTR